jgi:hypothetical protein
MLSLKRVRTHGPRLLTTGVGSTCSTSSVAGVPCVAFSFVRAA